MSEIITSNKARCLSCLQVVESKHRHDYVTCECGRLSVDGGLDYLKRSYNYDNGSQGYEELSTGKEDKVETKHTPKKQENVVKPIPASKQFGKPLRNISVKPIRVKPRGRG